MFDPDDVLFAPGLARQGLAAPGRFGQGGVDHGQEQGLPVVIGGIQQVGRALRHQGPDWCFAFQPGQSKPRIGLATAGGQR